MSTKPKTKKDVENASFTLGAKVDAETYYTFQYIAKTKGMNKTELLTFLVSDFLKNEYNEEETA